MPDAAPTASATAAPTKPAPKPVPRDSVREFVETVVFVVALVLMLKLFVVEAFVIPTGSMAETLFGYQKLVHCPECGFDFPVNSSNEVDPPDGGRANRVLAACCPNCRYRADLAPDPSDRRAGAAKPGDFPFAPNRSGDRVLVHKGVYAFDGGPVRGDVVVFKFPVDPQVKHTAQNYIKRLWGFGGETIAINRGDLYVTRQLDYPPGQKDAHGAEKYRRPEDPALLWEGPEAEKLSKTRPPLKSAGADFTYHNTEAAVDAFLTDRKKGFPAGGFELIRKTDDQLLAMRRIVYDNDFQAKSLTKAGAPPRWQADPVGWTPDNPAEPRAFAHTGPDRQWVRYQHLVPRTRAEWETPALVKPSVVKNFMGYNSGVEEIGGGFRSGTEYWVGDLISECRAEVKAAGAELTLELSKGPHRYQATLGAGRVTLARTGPGKQATDLTSAACAFDGPGTYDLRFANVDCRLRVWVNGKAVPFGPAADVPPDPLPEEYAANEDPMREGWTLENDVAAPASIGAKGDVAVSKLKLWRDTYFTYSDGPDAAGVAGFVDTFYVQPGHYLCLGDNSAQSSDSRKWGTVPERLMLGKAVFVFAPFFGDSWLQLRTDRVGFIK